jgi:ASC-1-like (ASCH) protein
MAFANEYRTEHPKKIILNVGPSTFDQIEGGLKILEMRLKKGNQTKINVGDILIFKLQTGEDKKAEDEIFAEKKVVAVRTHIGLNTVAEKENFKQIFPNRVSKEDFIEKITSHYRKIAKSLDLDTAEFEVLEFKNI